MCITPPSQLVVPCDITSADLFPLDFHRAILCPLAIMEATAAECNCEESFRPDALVNAEQNHGHRILWAARIDGFLFDSGNCSR